MTTPFLAVFMEYFGEVSIEYWEYSLMFFYVLAIYFYFARQKNLKVRTEPEYQYFLWGLFAKIGGGIFFSLIYFYYYHGGDTMGYFYSAMAICRVAESDPMGALHVIFGANSVENLQYFTAETGKPYNYLYFDTRTFMVIRLIAPFAFVSFGSFLITTVFIASVSYSGPWRCYQTFHRYFPSLRKELAIAFLFMPSAIFWGSAILKDTFTFSAVCWCIHAVDNIFFRRRDWVVSIGALLVGTWLIIAIKPYIFMALFPLLLLWIFYARVNRLRNALVKYVILPAAVFGLMALTMLVLSSLGDELGKFSLDNSLETITVNQNDLKRDEEYGSNYFDVGEIDPTWGSVLSKIPVATNAALFRPYLWESRNAVMMLAGLENLFLLFIAVRLVWLSKGVLIITMMAKNPIVLMCVVFSLVYGFFTGISTPNFGALVRFKIPLLPLFVAGIYIMTFLLRARDLAFRRGRSFRFEDYVSGEPREPRPLGKADHKRTATA